MNTKTARKTLHLMTQRGQPYGSVRLCCERCGLMIASRPGTFWPEHAYAEDERDYHEDYVGYVTCEKVQ